MIQTQNIDILDFIPDLDTNGDLKKDVRQFSLPKKVNWPLDESKQKISKI